MCVTVVAILIATTVVELRIGRTGGREALDDTSIGDSGIPYAVTGLLIATAALVVLRSGRARAFGWVLAAIGVFWAADGLAQAYVRFAMVSDESLPAITFAVWFLYRFTALLPLTIVAQPLLFPHGRFVAGAWGVAGRATVATLAGTALLAMIVPFSADSAETPLPPGADPDPTTVEAVAPIADFVPLVFAPAIALGLVVPIGTVVVRYRRSRGVERDRERWLLWATLTATLLTTASLLVGSETLTAVTLFIVIGIVPAAMAVAVVNPSLVSIEELLARTAVFGGLALVLVAIDLAAIATLTMLLDEALDQRTVVVVVLLVSIVLYGPLRARLWGWVRRIALGERGNPFDVVASLATTLESTEDTDAQLAAVASAVASAFGVGFVRVEVQHAAGERLVATHGEAPDHTRTLPITYRGADVGRLVLPARGLRSQLSSRDEQLLADLVRQAATAARTAQLADELQESRHRLVVAREEERRRIRRDLHDGLGPAVSGVVFQLESARLLIDADPEAAKGAVARTSALLRDVVADVRRLVHDLRPPALDDRGLVGALAQLAEQMTREGVTTAVTAGDLGPLPAAVEVAAYRVVGEAMTNVSRHARAASCAVTLTTTDDDLIVEITDDGVGIAADAESGIGLVSLRERAAELGGRTEVTCPETGGTRVCAWLPLRGNP